MRVSEGTPESLYKFIFELNHKLNRILHLHCHFEPNCRFVGTFTPFFAIAPKKPMSMSEEKYKKTNRGPFEKLLNPADAL